LKYWEAISKAIKSSAREQKLNSSSTVSALSHGN
jgi:hypothetical protein